jgi:diguanylate cyclase (GGDEF)-like protein/PAS domain S-box-containing protein
MRQRQTPTVSRQARNLRSLDDPETLRHLTRSIGEGIYISDRAGQVLDCNPAFLRIFGMSSLGELQRYNVAELLADPARRDEEMALLERHGSVREFELEIARPDGQKRTVLDTTYRLVDPDSGEVFYHGILVDITRRKELEDQLRQQLIRDVLTGCYNRRFLLDFEQNLKVRGEGRWGCIYVDVDHFKQFNDRYGHHAGDQVLQRMARFLMREVRSEEPVIRMGGDEFLIVLVGENALRTEDVARRLRQAAARSAPVAFSLGWALRQGDEPLEETIERADQSLIHVRVLSRSGDHASLPPEMERRQRGW